ncbi:MAG: tripartite tricarboxylate transporter TctB family protein [Hyphomicrobiales bacterium]
MKLITKYIQDSDIVTAIVSITFAILFYNGTPHDIWDGYTYIDWVFPLLSTFTLGFVGIAFTIISIYKIYKKNTIEDLKVEKSQLESIKDVLVYLGIVFLFLVLLFVFGFWPAAIFFLWTGIFYFSSEKNLKSARVAATFAVIVCAVAWVVFSSGYAFYVPFPSSRVFM